MQRPYLGLATLLALAACQSHSSDQQATTGTAAPAAATTPAAAPAVENSPGASYTAYRGTIEGQPDSITLHLVTTPQPHYDNPGPSSTGSYYGADGHPYEVGSQASAPDSLVLADYSPEHGSSPTAEPPVWRLKRQANGSLTGLVGSRAIQLRPVPAGAGVSFTVRTLADSLAAYPEKASSPKMRIHWQALLPVGGPAALTASILRDERGDTTDARPALPLAELFRQQRDTLFNDYRADVRALGHDSPDERPSAMLNYEQQSATSVLFQRGNLLSLGFFVYDYTGGAHGMNGTTVASYDLRTGRCLRYNDIFQPHAARQLPVLLGRVARQLLGHAPDGAAADGGISPTHNVFLTSGGVEFVYQPYEIASYAQGEVRVFLPLAQVRGLLRDGLPLPAAGVAAR